MPVSLWWIRRDLRLEDNNALTAARKKGNPIIPVFILYDALMKTPLNRRSRFLIAGLKDIQTHLRELGSGLVIRRGDAAVELQKLVQETDAECVFAEEDYSPYAKRRDEEAARIVPLSLSPGLTVFHPGLTVKPDGNPYTVFTPYSRKWKSLPFFHSVDRTVNAFAPAAALPASLDLPAAKSVDGFPASSSNAEHRLEEFLTNRLDSYSNTRNRMDLEGTSTLSPYIRFGMISVSHIINQWRAAIDIYGRNSNDAWLNELIWRDFYQSILYYFPRVRDGAFRQKYACIPWRDCMGDLHAWQSGQTGYPIVDAGMRQLSSTGWMHNRARMITASFLTKDLLINWQEGELWFMDQLVDGDHASNNGGWQWAAGTGTDAAPYFRIFHPVLQSKKFDPHGAYIRRWVPELAALPDRWLHEPWEMTSSDQQKYGVAIGKTYPAPIVDHTFARERALTAYKAAG